MVNLKINNIDVSVDEGTTIINAAAKAGINIPSLCYLRDINQIGACRICVVEVKGARGLVTACSHPVDEGMQVFTNTKRVMAARKNTLSLILSDHDKQCTSCVRGGNCELNKLSVEYGCSWGKFSGKMNEHSKDQTDFLVRDNNKCILCRRCEAVCRSVQSVGVIGANERGFKTNIGCAFTTPLKNVPCVACGQCINVCPTGALSERSEIDRVVDALNDPEKVVIAGTAPAVRVALGEEFGFDIGSDVEGRMVSALKLLGFSKVFDVNMTADLTIMEEGYEFLGRLKNNGMLPMITSCSPGWIRYIEYYYPDLLPHLSSCKSPQQMFGAVMKTYYAKKFNIPVEKLFVTTIMPCVAKKFEKTRTHQAAATYPDIDAVLTTRELAKLIKRAGIDFKKIPNQDFDNPIGEGSGAGLIFGASGGVMEAALRTLSEVILNRELKNLDFIDVRGMNGVKEADYDLDGVKVKVCVASGIKNAKTIMDQIASGESKYHFVEIMCCPGGCINGGGQPIHHSHELNNVDIKSLRMKAIYESEKKKAIRKSHENPIIKELYSEYFGEPNSHVAHKVLHTKYTRRSKY